MQLKMLFLFCLFSCRRQRHLPASKHEPITIKKKSVYMSHVMLLVMCCLFVFPHNDFPQVCMPHQEVVICFTIFPVGVQGSVMRKPHASSRAAPKERRRLLSLEVSRTIVLLCQCYSGRPCMRNAAQSRAQIPTRRYAYMNYL